MFQTARVMIYNPTAPHSSLQVRMVLDSGSQRSYITYGVKEALALEAEGEQLTAFGSNEPSTQKCVIVRVGMSLHNSPDQELQLFAVPSICGPLTAQPIPLFVTEYDHLSHLELADSSDGKSDLSIDILIGADHYWDIVTGEIKRGREGPIAIRTKLGWVLSGPASRIKPTPSLHNLFITYALYVGHRESDTDVLNQTMNLESHGVVDPDQSTYTEFEKDLRMAVTKFPSHGRIHTSFFQTTTSCASNGYMVSYDDYDKIQPRFRDVIKEQIEQGIVEVVPDPDSMQADKVCYLPHHAVIRQDKETTKLRIVYDASAKSTGPSLNECLQIGPKFDQCILDILQRFRTQKIALTADIEKAFLMISIHKKDRDVLRFCGLTASPKISQKSEYCDLHESCLASRQALPTECYHQTSSSTVFLVPWTTCRQTRTVHLRRRYCVWCPE